VRSLFHTNVSINAFRPHISISAVEHGIRMTSTGYKHNERVGQFTPETGAEELEKAARLASRDVPDHYSTVDEAIQAAFEATPDLQRCPASNPHEKQFFGWTTPSAGPSLALTSR
jgi:hypothetical protein